MNKIGSCDISLLKLQTRPARIRTDEGKRDHTRPVGILIKTAWNFAQSKNRHMSSQDIIA